MLINIHEIDTKYTHTKCYLHSVVLTIPCGNETLTLSTTECGEGTVYSTTPPVQSLAVRADLALAMVKLFEP